MTKQEFEARQLIGNWLAKNKIKVIGKLRHVQPRAYVIGYAAPLCLIVARPWMDAEPQLRGMERNNPLSTFHTFDDTLKPGDWCATAYYVTQGRSERVAVAWRAKA